MPSTSGKKPGQKPGAKRKRSKKQNPQTTSRFASVGSTSTPSACPSTPYWSSILSVNLVLLQTIQLLLTLCPLVMTCTLTHQINIPLMDTTTCMLTSHIQVSLSYTHGWLSRLQLLWFTLCNPIQLNVCSVFTTPIYSQVHNWLHHIMSRMWKQILLCQSQY